MSHTAISRPSLCLLTMGLAALAAAAPALADPLAADDALPLRGIHLYRSGLGYFERSGQVSGDQQVNLVFSDEHMNDILKSMVILDAGGGSIGSVTYGRELPLSQRLGDFALQVSASLDMADLLKQLAGQRVRIATASDEATGTVLSVEQREVSVPEENRAAEVNQPFVSLVTDEGIRSYAIYDIRSFEILDEQLAAELRKALAVLAENNTEETTAVKLELLGEDRQERQVFIGYTHAMPVWKTSYRLVLPELSSTDSEAAQSEASCTLQGWAIVENTTASDWEAVRLSLVSGRPVSFTMDLAEPIFVERPEAPVPIAQAADPKIYQLGRELESKALNGDGTFYQEARFAAGADLALRTRGSVDAAVPADAAAMPGSAAFTEYMMQSQAAGLQVGGQFMYRVKEPVSLPRQHSALLPILQAEIPCRRVSIYNPRDLSHHPMSGARIDNESGLQLAPGPISVFDGATYAGDALIPNLTKGQEQLLTFAVDLDVSVDHEATSEAAVERVTIDDGLIRQQYVEKRQSLYKLTSLDEERGRTVIVEHAKSGPEWQLISKAGLIEETPDFYRFELQLPPGGEADFPVVQERTYWQSYALTSASLEDLLVYARSGKVSQEVIDAVKHAAALQSEINRLAEKMTALEQDRNFIFEDQNRIRSNMGRIDHDSELYARYMEQLETQEDKLAVILEQLDKLEVAHREAEQALREFLSDLTID